MVKHETFEWQSTKLKSKKPSRVSKLRSKRIKRTIVLGLLLMLALMTWWYFFIRIPNVYGQLIENAASSPSYHLVFKGKKYKELVLNKYDTSTFHYWGINLGQVKTYPSDGPIVVSSVFGHPDWLTVQDKIEMGPFWVFQEEK